MGSLQCPACGHVLSVDGVNERPSERTAAAMRARLAETVERYRRHNDALEVSLAASVAEAAAAARKP